jgi:hypothetical protein
VSSPNLSLNLDGSTSIVSIVGSMFIRKSFPSRGSKREQLRKERYHLSHGMLEPRMPIPRAKTIVCTILAWGDRKS